MFSKACEYGIKAITYIAKESLKGNRVKTGDIAANTDSPEAFTAKILGLLTKYDIVSSQTGPNGGFEIGKDRMKEIKISEIVNAIDGDAIYNGCALGFSECNSEKPCPMHHKFVKVRGDIKKMLTTTTVYDLAYGLKTGKSVLKR
ncbi:MAG: Rrf2 family transcriptional regulator [Chitinophagales bacterium]|nr:Rrf2 family transcriptional regulator [Chitinophagales bacterium]